MQGGTWTIQCRYTISIIPEVLHAYRSLVLACQKLAPLSAELIKFRIPKINWFLGSGHFAITSGCVLVYVLSIFSSLGRANTTAWSKCNNTWSAQLNHALCTTIDYNIAFSIHLTLIYREYPSMKVSTNSKTSALTFEGRIEVLQVLVVHA